MLKITAIGNLTNDVELKMNETTGKPYAILRIASDRRYKDKDGNKLTDFISIKVRGPLAERCAEFAWKGCKLAASGDFETITFEDEPERQPGFLIKASEVEFLSPRKVEETAQRGRCLMKNTGITYTSAERSPVILPEMAELLPPLSAEQLDALEADLIKNGCYAPIIVNEDMVIIDGHNRQALCEKHGLPYTMAVFSFEDLLEAKQWALDTQKNRRNLEKWELGKIALKLKPEIEAKAKANMAAGGQNFRPSEAEEGSATLPNLPSVEKAVDTRKELAEAVGLGERTMGKVMQIDENAPDAIKEALDKKELSINKGYDLTRQLHDVPEQNAEIDRRGKVANTFCKAYEKASLLTAAEEDVRCWTEGTRMTLEELQDTVKESREIAQVFAAIADIIEQKILPADWRNTGPAEDIPCEVAS